MPQSTQSKRLVRINTVLDTDAILVNQTHGFNAMSDGFYYTLDAFSEKVNAIKEDQLIGTNATFVVMNEDDKETFYNGFITSMSSLGLSSDRATISYRLTIESGLCFLNKQTDCRVFQEQSLPDVIDKVLAPLIGANFKVKKQYQHANKTQQRFITQYNETNEHFFKRLCRRANIAFYFEMENGCHTLNLIDNSAACNTLKVPIRLQPHTIAHDHLDTWSQHSRIVTGIFSQRTYNYKEVNAGTQPMTQDIQGQKAKLSRVDELESYLFSDEYSTAVDGLQHLKNTLQRGTERQRFFQGAGDCRFLKVGTHFRIKTVPQSLNLASPDEEYTTTRIELSANVISSQVRTSLEAVPKGDLVYPVGEKPHIYSVQSAVVAGPEGSEIHSDKYGRVKVRFFWDRDSKKRGEDCTCFLRVMQPMAGAQMGAHFTPRVGDEVVVAFTNGDPDRPFITGTLHHPESPPPYTKQKGTRAGFRTRSTPGGGANNCNELYFEDKKGSEEVYLQAEKDLNAKIKRNEVRKIGDTLFIDAGKKITLQVGGSIIEMTNGKISISSSVVDIDAGTIKLN